MDSFENTNERRTGNIQTSLDHVFASCQLSGETRTFKTVIRWRSKLLQVMYSESTTCIFTTKQVTISFYLTKQCTKQVISRISYHNISNKL